MEGEQHWDTFGVGSTCCFGGHNLAVADIDDDGLGEIITGGFAYSDLSNSTLRRAFAPLKIWNWDGMKFILKKSYNWTGYLRCVYTGDIDCDGCVELITAGGLLNTTGIFSSLRILVYNGEDWVLSGSYEGKEVITSVFVSDVDGNGEKEIIITGASLNGNSSVIQIMLFNWDGKDIKFNTSVDCFEPGKGQLNSVYACDLDYDGKVEIIAVGYSGTVKNSSGYLGIWQFNGAKFSQKSEIAWQKMGGAYSVDVAGNPMGNTMASKLKVSDVDADGVQEIITGGFTYDGSKVEGQLRIWSWNGETLRLEKSQEWAILDITNVTSLSFGDVDGDGEIEIVTSGYTAGYRSWAPNASGKTRGELKIWSWNGNVLRLEQSKDWIVGEAFSAWNVETGDVDNDSVIEIVTVGCMQIGILCDPDLRIWMINLPQNIFEIHYFLIATFMGIMAIITAIAFMLMRKWTTR